MDRKCTGTRTRTRKLMKTVEVRTHEVWKNVNVYLDFLSLKTSALRIRERKLVIMEKIKTTSPAIG
jgi:hypothetical protein